eukprot:2506099-Pyramimonas_sp.AAC.1
MEVTPPSHGRTQGSPTPPPAQPDPMTPIAPSSYGPHPTPRPPAKGSSQADPCQELKEEVKMEEDTFEE